MRIKLYLSLLSLLSAGPIYSNRSLKSQPFAKTNVCEVLRHEGEFKLRRVRIVSEVKSDGKHGAMLTDTHCPLRGLGLAARPSNANDSVTELEEALRGEGSPGTTGRRVTGEFFGRLVLDRESKHLRIAISRVDNLSSVRVEVALPNDNSER